ncbi:hypothetical protein PG993_012726 [Apiospora rasikravindrae]|uniref:NB-ARC domain-containing protein n=1 Tax=Apiospora rasikravindrae TaxID=990691 RepID=A0ABR1RVK7_9PEZI
MSISIKPDAKDPMSTVCIYLGSEAAGKWLFIVDNADNTGFALLSSRGLRAYLPESETGLVILTTRSPDVALSVADEAEYLEEMGTEEATDLLEKHLGSRTHPSQDPETTTRLLRELTCLPLAITQAAAYLNRNRHVSLTRYLELLRGTEQDMTSLLSREFADITRYRGSQNAIAATWIVSFDQIQDMDPEAASLLTFISCIEPKDIPRSILPSFDSDEKLDHAIGTLCGYSFLAYQEASGMYDMHRLVHVATRVWLRKHGRAVLADADAIRRLGAIFPDWHGGDYQVWRTYYPHVFRLLDRSETSELNERYDLCFQVGTCLHTERRSKITVLYLEPVSRWVSQHLEDKDDRRLAVGHWLGSAYYHVQRMQERVVHIKRRTLDENNQHRISSEGELGRAYLVGGRTREAIEIFVKTIAVNKAVFHEWDISLLSPEYYLAKAYLETHKTKEAIKILEHVVEIAIMTIDRTLAG